MGGFTQKQYQQARGTSALAYAMEQGYDLVPCGQRFELREHRSMVFLRNGRWFWNSQHLAGGALEFVRHYENRSLVDAVLILASRKGKAPLPAMKERAPAKFHLPPKEAQAGPLMAYLTGRRGLDVEIVTELVDQGRIHMTTVRRGAARYNNAVFVGYDAAGAPRSAQLRGMGAGVSYKGFVLGSDKAAMFCVPGKGARRLAIFEAPIDAISHASYERRQGAVWRDTERIALGGNPPPETVRRYLARRPELRTVLLCLDKDEAGRSLDARLRAELKGFDGQIITCLPPAGKDWNDALLAAAKTEAGYAG